MPSQSVATHIIPAAAPKSNICSLSDICFKSSSTNLFSKQNPVLLWVLYLRASSPDRQQWRCPAVRITPSKSGLMSIGRAMCRKAVKNEDRNIEDFRVQFVTSHNKKLSTNLYIYIYIYIYLIYKFGSAIFDEWGCLHWGKRMHFVLKRSTTRWPSKHKSYLRQGIFNLPPKLR